MDVKPELTVKLRPVTVAQVCLVSFFVLDQGMLGGLLWLCTQECLLAMLRGTIWNAGMEPGHYHSGPRVFCFLLHIFFKREYKDLCKFTSIFSPQH